MTTPTFTNPRFPQGSLVLVTGATGLVGSNVTTELIIAGYKVRAITRDAQRAQPLKQAIDSQYGSGKIEIIELKDPLARGVLDTVVKGVSGIVHVATDSSMSVDFDAVVRATVGYNNGLLEAAAKNKDVKSVVFTSSIAAAFNKMGPQPIMATEQSYFNDAIKLAQTMNDDEPTKGPVVYMASKVKAEQEAWAFVKGKDFAFNTILPDWVSGSPTNPDKTSFYSTYGWFREFAKGEYGPHTKLYQFLNPPSFYNDVKDVARAHVAALIADEVRDRRIYAMTEPWSVVELAEAIHKTKPHLVLPDISGSSRRSDMTVPNQPFKDLLQKYYGRSATLLDETVADTIADL